MDRKKTLSLPISPALEKNKSCQGNLGILFFEIYKGYARGHVTVCVSLDVAGAFDNVIPNLLIKDLIDLEIRPKICLFIYNLICYREFQFVGNGELSSTFYSYKGVPQGSILSPLLFNIYVSKIHNYVSKNCKIVQFADDIAILISGPSSQIIELSRKLKTPLINLSNFFNSKGLNISTEKSALMIFSRTKSTPTSPLIELNGHPIKSVSTFRFLGIYLDLKLLEDAHIDSLVKKSNRLINVIKSLCGTWWGSDPLLLLRIYKSLIKGSIEYGCQLLPIIHSSKIDRLEKIQRKAIKICIGLRSSTPLNVVLAESLLLNFVSHSFQKDTFLNLSPLIIIQL